MNELTRIWLISVRDIGGFLALVEVDRLAHIKWSAFIFVGSVALRLLHSVNNFTFAFKRDFGDGEDWGVSTFLVLLWLRNARLHFESLDVVALQVQLNHVKDGTLDVL